MVTFKKYSNVWLSSLITILSGNIFRHPLHLCLCQKERLLNILLSAYAFITQLFILGIARLNLFKPYVTDTFVLAMGVFLVLSLLYIVMAILCTKYVTATEAPKWMLIPGIVLLLATFTGNLFATLLGYSLIQKARRANPSSIEKWQKYGRRFYAIQWLYSAYSSLFSCSRYPLQVLDFRL